MSKTKGKKTEETNKSVNVGSYLVSKNGAKYLKFESPKGKNAPTEPIFPMTINEGDVMFLGFFDDEFREKYNVPDFVKARIQKTI